MKRIIWLLLIGMVLAEVPATSEKLPPSSEEDIGIALLVYCAVNDWDGWVTWDGEKLPCSLVRSSFLAQPGTRKIVAIIEKAVELPITSRPLLFLPLPEVSQNRSARMAPETSSNTPKTDKAPATSTN